MAEPVTGAQHPAVQRLERFSSQSRWDTEQVHARRLELLVTDPATAQHGGGVLVIDDSGGLKDGTRLRMSAGNGSAGTARPITARALAWDGPDDPGECRPVTRTFRDGHAWTWYAADAELGWWGPDGARRLVAPTADPGTLPEKATWYLVTNLPRPGSPCEAGSPHPAAGLAEIVRI